MATIRNLIVRISVTEKTDKGIRKVTTSLREVNREVDQADKGSSRFSGTLSKLGRNSLSGLLGGMKTLSKVTLTTGKGLLVVASAASALNTATQAGVGLAPLLGGLALLPAVALSAGVALGTLKLATSGVGDAFSAAMSGDAGKLKDSLKDLAPAAQATAKELFALRPTLLGIRNAAQQALFAPLVGQMTALAKVLDGPVKTGVAAVAGQFGVAGRQVAEFARQSKSVELVRAAFGQTQLSVSILRTALDPLLAGFRALATEGLSFLPQIATAVAQIGTRFGEWLQKVVASGQATKWIENFLTTLKQIGGILTQVGGIFKSVFSAASAAGSGFLGVIGQALAQLNAFLQTAAGKSALQGIFQALGAIGQTLGPVIASLVTGLGTLAPPLGQLAQLVGPILTTAVTALAPALAALAPGLKALFTGLGSAVELLAPALLPLGKAIAQIGVAIGPILPIVGQLVGQLVAGLAPILGQLFVALGPLVGAIVQFAGALTPLIPPLAQIIVQLVSGLVPALTPIIGILGQVAGVIGQFLVSALGMLINAIVPLLPQISQMAQTIGSQLLIVLIQLSPALLQILTALLPLLPALVNLAQPLVQLTVVLTPVLTLVIRLAAAILSKLLPPLVSLITLGMNLYTSLSNGAVRGLNLIITTIGKIPGTISSIFKGAGSWLKNAGVAIINGLVDGIRSAIGWLKDNLNWVTSLIPSWKGPIDVDRKLLTPSGAAIMGGLMSGITSQLPALQRTLGDVTDQIRVGVTTPTAPAGLNATAASAPAGVAAAASGGGLTAHLVLDVSNAADEFGRAIQKTVRVKGGGDVQLAFGGR